MGLQRPNRPTKTIRSSCRSFPISTIADKVQVGFTYSKNTSEIHIDRNGFRQEPRSERHKCLAKNR